MDQKHFRLVKNISSGLMTCGKLLKVVLLKENSSVSLLTSVQMFQGIELQLSNCHTHYDEHQLSCQSKM